MFDKSKIIYSCNLVNAVYMYRAVASTEIVWMLSSSGDVINKLPLAKYESLQNTMHR